MFFVLYVHGWVAQFKDGFCVDVILLGTIFGIRVVGLHREALVGTIFLTPNRCTQTYPNMKQTGRLFRWDLHRISGLGGGERIMRTPSRIVLNCRP